MTKAKYTGIFLQCVVWLVTAELITASTISFSKDGHVGFEYNMNARHAHDQHAKNIAQQINRQ